VLESYEEVTCPELGQTMPDELRPPNMNNAAQPPTMMTNRKLRCSLLLALALGFFPADTRAVGYRLPNQDPEAIARGNAFAATADNPSAIYYNPAGITQLEGLNTSAGLYFVSPGIRFDGPGGTAHTSSNPDSVPQFYAVYTPEKLPLSLPLSFGLGIYVPYGLSEDWGQNSPFKNIVQTADLLYLCFNPVVAWKINPRLSVAVGPTINYSKATMQQAIPAGGLVPPGAEFLLNGDGLGYGFNAGVLWKPFDQWAFGVNYRSPTIIDYHGETATIPAPLPPSQASTTSIRFPQFVVGGISFRPTEKWNLEFDLDWADWDTVKQIDVSDTAAGTIPIPLNYRSSFMYEFGITRQLPRGYFASAGFFFSQNSSPSGNFTPLIADSALYLGGLGVGHKGKHWGWALGYQFGYNPGRNVSNDQTSPVADGTYHVFNNALNLSASYHF
jgi:long-chain fatty acid transport protein